MRGRIALQALLAKFSRAFFRLAKLWECARVLASLLSCCSVRCPQRILCLCEATCAGDSAGYSFATSRIFRARSTTIADVTCFIQA
jgi:hypothetical protein